ncbi:MAG TPA: alpha/beta fold hydrolase [Candidatus Dormibacteraeota bacterium]|nr:alpha/beta fold hydrolase [Candidatus Dormibacteraeota bacterium]
MPFTQSCRPVRIVTPKKYMLDGLWFGAARPKTGIVFVHGLGGNAFSHHDYLEKLANRNTAVLYFSNRGHDTIAGLKRLKPSARKGYVYEDGGVAHEIFTDCADDLQGAADLLRKRGAKRIFLVGHSTGCQKIAYYLSRAGKQARIAHRIAAQIRGAVLLCPISDYASATHEDERKRHKAEIAARKLLRRGKPHDLLPANLWRGPIDAQRWVSLYTPDSKEEIFTYAQPPKAPRAVHKLKIPLLVIFAGDDEYRDRPTGEMAAWFRKNLRSPRAAIEIIPGASHSFNGKEASLAKFIRRWLRMIGYPSTRNIA